MYKVPWTVNMKSRMFYNEELQGVYMFVPGLMAMILMLISALMTSVTITREKEFGTMELSTGVTTETQGDHPG